MKIKKLGLAGNWTLDNQLEVRYAYLPTMESLHNWSTETQYRFSMKIAKKSINFHKILWPGKLKFNFWKKDNFDIWKKLHPDLGNTLKDIVIQILVM